MPRYKFKWSNLSPSLLQALCRELLHADLDDDPASILRAAYGARPTQEFIRDAWPVLLESWLRTFKDRREWVVEALLEAGGESTSVSGRDAQMQYLRGLTNSKRLQEIVWTELVAAGEAANSMTDPFEMDDDNPEAPWNKDPVESLPAVITPGRIAIEFWKRGYNDEQVLYDFFFNWDGGREAKWFYDISSYNPGLSVMSSAPFSGTASWTDGSSVETTYFAGDFGLEGEETITNFAPKDDDLSKPQTWVDLAGYIAGFCDEQIQ